MTHASGAGPGAHPPDVASPTTIARAHFDRALLVSIFGAEAVLLVLFGGAAQPLVAAGLALSGVFLLVAYRAPDVAWALTWLSVPFSIEQITPAGAFALPSEPMVAVALAGWVLRLLAGERLRLGRSTFHAPLALLAGVALVSVLVGGFRVVGLKAWTLAAMYAAFGYLYFVVTPCDARRRERWFVLASAAAAVWGLYGMIRLSMIGISAPHAYGAARPFFPEHGTYAAYLAMLLPVPLLLALERQGAARIGYGAAALAALLGIVFSFTRAAWLSLVVVLPITLLSWAGRSGRWRALAIPALCLALAGVAVIVTGAGDRLSRHAGTVVETENVSNLERINRWVAAIEMSKDHPWLGVGFGAYPDAYPSYRRKTIVTELVYRHMGAHSEPLRLLAETGILGLAAALWFLGIAFTAGWKTSRAPGSVGVAALAVTAGLATYAIHGLFNSYLGIDKITVPFWIGLGTLASITRPSRPAEEAP